MESHAKLSLVAPAAVPPVAQQPLPNAPAEASRDVEAAASYRLVIEEGPTVGTFVYKTLNSTTGEVVRQFPREQVLRLAEARKYSAGSVIDTSA